MKYVSRTSWWILAGLTVLATALRLVNIGTEPFWGDEILSLDIATRLSSSVEMLRYLKDVEFHPPLYYVIVRGWAAAFGETEAAIRSLSLIFSAATVPLVYGFATRVFRDARTGLVSAAAMAVLPFLIEFGQEARPYAMMTFFLVSAAWAAFEHRRSRSWTYAFLSAASSLVAVYLHYSASFFILALAAWWAWDAIRAKDSLMPWFLAHAALALGFMPWADAFLYKTIVARYDLMGLSRELGRENNGVFFERLLHALIWPNKMESVSRWEEFAAFSVRIGFLTALFVAGRRAFGALRRETAFLGALFALPLLLFFVSPQSLGYSELFQRHVIFALVPLSVLAARLLVTLERRRALVLGALALASLLPATVFILDDDSKWQHQFALKGDALFITEQRKPGDLVIHAVTTDRSNLSRYVEGVEVVSLFPVRHLPGDDPWSTRHTLGMIENELQLRWFNEDPMPGDIERKIAYLVSTREADRVWLYAVGEGSVHAWFKERGWRHAIRQTGRTARLDLYVRPDGEFDSEAER